MAVGLRNTTQHLQAVYKTPKFNNTCQELGRKTTLTAYTNPVRKGCCKRIRPIGSHKFKESQYLLNFGLVLKPTYPEDVHHTFHKAIATQLLTIVYKGVPRYISRAIIFLWRFLAESSRFGSSGYHSIWCEPQKVSYIEAEFNASVKIRCSCLADWVGLQLKSVCGITIFVNLRLSLVSN